MSQDAIANHRDDWRFIGREFSPAAVDRMAMPTVL
jgi:hypothetical protein